ncbi:MAG: transglutaminase-like domain-containing protein [Chloroflexota bacterium]
MMYPVTTPIKEQFIKVLNKPDHKVDLAYSALLMSEYLNGPIKTKLYMGLLDDIAQTVRREIDSAETATEIIECYNEYLFDELKFIGNRNSYYNPGNSFFDKVLDARTGIPISLSLLYLEVGWRLGLPVWGVGLPGHFIVAYGPQAEPIYIDVFNQGRILSEEDCLELCKVHPTQRQTFKTSFLKPIDKKSILFRMLLNLKQIYVGLEDWESTYKTVDLMIAVRPNQTEEIRDRGLIAYRLNRLQAAIFDIERYLFLTPDNTDEDWLNKHLEMMEEQLILLN